METIISCHKQNLLRVHLTMSLQEAPLMASVQAVPSVMKLLAVPLVMLRTPKEVSSVTQLQAQAKNLQEKEQGTKFFGSQK